MCIPSVGKYADSSFIVEQISRKLSRIVFAFVELLTRAGELKNVAIH